MNVSVYIAIGSTVVAALALFVAWRQLGKLSQQLLLQHFADYTKRYQEIIFRFPEDVNMPDFVMEGREDYGPTMRAMRAYFDLCFEEWYLNQRGFLEAEMWALWQAGMATAFSKPAFRQAWEVITGDTRYGDGFNGFVSQLCAPCSSGQEKGRRKRG